MKPIAKKGINKYYIYAFITVLLWGTSSITIKSLLIELTGLQALTFAFLLASIFLFFIAWKQGKLKEIKTYKLKDYLIIFSLGGLGIFTYNMLNTYSYKFATGTEAATINYLWPIWIIMLSTIILKEKITKIKILATVISFFGMVLVVTRGNFSSFANANVLGIGQAILGSFCYGLFCVIVKKIRYDKTVSILLYFLSGAIIGIISIFLFSSFPHLTWQTSLWLLLRGFGQLGIAYVLWAMALMGDTVKISNLALITPFLQLTTLAIFTGEVIGVVPVLGLICIISGTIIARKAK